MTPEGIFPQTVKPAPTYTKSRALSFEAPFVSEGKQGKREAGPYKAFAEAGDLRRGLALSGDFEDFLRFAGREGLAEREDLAANRCSSLRIASA
jgi:hypothetical protein